MNSFKRIKEIPKSKKLVSQFIPTQKLNTVVSPVPDSLNGPRLDHVAGVKKIDFRQHVASEIHPFYL
jgi:hypothetical protein